MADVFDAEERSRIMARIRSSKNSSTELTLIRIFKEFHITGWRRNQPLPGKPDFVFRATRICVFVDGCFWHGCPKCYKPPKSNIEYWRAKIGRNVLRGQIVDTELERVGWRVLRILEHELLKKNRELLAFRFELFGLPVHP